MVSSLIPSQLPSNNPSSSLKPSSAPTDILSNIQLTIVTSIDLIGVTCPENKVDIDKVVETLKDALLETLSKGLAVNQRLVDLVVLSICGDEVNAQRSLLDQTGSRVLQQNTTLIFTATVSELCGDVDCGDGDLLARSSADAFRNSTSQLLNEGDFARNLEAAEAANGVIFVSDDFSVGIITDESFSE